MFLQKSAVLGVGFEVGIGKIAEEGYKANEEVDGDVDEHLDEDSHGQTALDLHTASDEQESNSSIDGVTGSGYDANNGGPSEACTEELEECHVHSVRATAHFGKDVGIVFRDVGRDGLLDLLLLARLAWVVDVYEERVLRDIRQFIRSHGKNKH